jgi:hypothetical protein
VTRGGRDVEVDVPLAHKMQRSFRIIPIANASALQSAILKDWMKAR